MAATTTRAGSNGRLITREDLQAAYAQVVGEGEASARAAAPRGIAIAGAVAILVIALAFLAGNWYWFLLAGATFFLRRVLNARTGNVSSLTLSPGEQVLITVRDRNTEPVPVGNAQPVAVDA